MGYFSLDQNDQSKDWAANTGTLSPTNREPKIYSLLQQDVFPDPLYLEELLPPVWCPPSYMRQADSIFMVMKPKLVHSVVFAKMQQNKDRQKLFFCVSFSLHSSFTISSPPPYRWSQAAFNNPMHSHASTPEATPLMLHYSHTHIRGGSASSLGRTPVSQAQIGSVWFSMEQ